MTMPVLPPALVAQLSIFVAQYISNQRTKYRPAAVPLSAEQSPDELSPEELGPEDTSRRELIARYGKYAVVATPLLLFVSKAAGQEADPEIHSVP